ncbi:hypothetical protein [Limnospira platensis]
MTGITRELPYQRPVMGVISNSHFGENLFKSPASLYRNDIQETQERQSR